MKKGFTLVEMLIVVVVLVTLMSITFRLSSIGSDQEARSVTIAHMQRLENCLSGYYAAFGSYPPVSLHQSRNIYLKVNGQGIQNVDGEEGKDIWGWEKIGESAEAEAWLQVSAACSAQPVACEFPFAKLPNGKGKYAAMVAAVSKTCQILANSGKEEYKSFWDPPSVKEKFAAGFDDLVSENMSRHGNEDLKKNEWRNIQLFKFGLMSFLLPRYLVMMNSDETFYRSSCAQWCNNNTKPANALTGEEFSDWNAVRSACIDGEKNSSDYASVANVPSQAVCSRWLPNLAGACACNHSTTIMGIDIAVSGGTYNLAVSSDPGMLKIYSPHSGQGENYSNQYVLDGITVRDGWGNDFYYYSAPPYQDYVLWSAGPNGRTFPPWLDRASMSTAANRCIGLWIADDVKHLSN